MSDILLKAEPRTALGGATAKSLRAKGRVPGVLYGHGEASTAFHVKELDLRPLIFERLLLSAGAPSQITDCQYDPRPCRLAFSHYANLQYRFAWWIGLLGRCKRPTARFHIGNKLGAQLQAKAPLCGGDSG